MARARNIKPGFFTNEYLVELCYEYRLLFIGLWMLADKAGRLEDRPKKVKMEVFPADNVDVAAGLDALAGLGFIVRYTVNGGNYIQINNWSKHQSPHHTEKDSVIPPLNNGDLPVNTQKQHGGNPPDSLIPDSLIPDSSVVEGVDNSKSIGAKNESSSRPAMDRAVEVAKLLQENGIDATPAMLRASKFTSALGQPDADWIAAAESACAAKPGERISANYLLPKVIDMMRAPQPRASPPKSNTRDAGRIAAARSIFPEHFTSEAGNERTINGEYQRV